MSETTAGPMVRWVNPLRIRTRRHADGWTAEYQWRNHGASVHGCATRDEAVRSLRHFITMRVVEVDGKWTEAPR